jgi:threonine synthase
MKFYSTRDKKKLFPHTFSDAVIKGMADDHGLFIPEAIPSLPENVLSNLSKYNDQELAFIIIKSFLKDELSDESIKEILKESINFPYPIKKLDDTLFILELFHGPTLAFKDFGARFLAHTVAKINEKRKDTLNIIVATSGDTGGAVASAFHKVPGIDVFILYPDKKISLQQEKQISTYGDNINAIAINGTFDDCQRLVKQVLDKENGMSHLFSTANSINVARLLPQILYYFFAAKNFSGKSLVFSVPCGNLGNLSAAIIAKMMGLPIEKIVACSNTNDVFIQYLQHGAFKSKASHLTLSNAMDVGNPSNLERINYFFNDDLNKINQLITGVSISETETLDTIESCYEKHHYLIDPHTAVAMAGIEKCIEQLNSNAIKICLSTAHPAKFPETLKKILSIEIPAPEQLKSLEDKPLQKTKCEAELSALIPILQKNKILLS